MNNEQRQRWLGYVKDFKRMIRKSDAWAGYVGNPFDLDGSQAPEAENKMDADVNKMLDSFIKALEDDWELP